MKRHLPGLLGFSLLLGVSAAHAIQRHPTGVNVNASGASTVYITFGDLQGQTPAEGQWCGELLPAAPDIGQKCDPATIFGVLPERYDRSRLSQDGKAYTDIMSIPPSVSRRAYQAARRGENSAFFYVRRFTRPGGPDEYVTITCRLTGGGARVPLALLDVRLGFARAAPVLFVQPGQALPPLSAEIAYNGTGRLKGRWEVVLPGQEPPTEEDLLTEATLPPERRALQRRYTEVDRFNVYLPPTGKLTLPGPDPALFPTAVLGQHMVLLRIEASEDRESDSNLALAGAGAGVVHAGGAAAFPIPPLRYVVGSVGEAGQSGEELRQLAPDEGAILGSEAVPELRWAKFKRAAQYRVELQDLQGRELLSAAVEARSLAYVVPPFVQARASGGRLRWRVVAIGAAGEQLQASVWRALRLEAAP